MGYLYAINKSIIIQKAIVIALKDGKIIFATEPKKELEQYRLPEGMSLLLYNLGD